MVVSGVLGRLSDSWFFDRAVCVSFLFVGDGVSHGPLVLLLTTGRRVSRSPADAIRAVFAAGADDLRRDEFRGCAFNNAASSFQGQTTRRGQRRGNYRLELLSRLADDLQRGVGGARLTSARTVLPPGARPWSNGSCERMGRTRRTVSDAYEQVEVTSAAELRRWLASHHDSSPGIWLVTYKKAAGEKHLAYEDIVCEALCFGWIDSKGRALDDLRSQLLLTPRKPSSSWSRPNKERVTRLEADGRMAAAGRAMVELARASGTWNALDDVENLVEPPALAAALNANPAARHHWDTFPRTTKRATLEWISHAKRPATQAKRIAEIVELAAQNLRPQQWPRPS